MAVHGGIVNINVSNNFVTSEENLSFLEDMKELTGNRLIIYWGFSAGSEHRGSLTDKVQGRALDNALIKTNLSVLNSAEMMPLATLIQALIST